MLETPSMSPSRRSPPRLRLAELAATPADPLGAVLHSLRIEGVFYCHSELTEPWGLTMPPMPGCAWFHVLVAGRCRVQSRAFGAVSLAPGDFALVPHGEGHVLRSAAHATAPLVTALSHDVETERYALLRHGGGGAAATLVCGVVRLEHVAASLLASALPPVVHLDGLAAPQAEWMQTTVRLMASEARRLQPGGEAVVTRLADILVVQSIRAWLESDASARVGWLQALRDPALGPALGVLHRDPGGAHSVAALAAAVHMSRSAFADRFVRTIGQTPMDYLTRLRMQLARAQLALPGASVGEVAEKCGYRSVAAFGRAYKRVLGTAPGASKRSRTIPTSASRATRSTRARHRVTG